MASCQVSQLIHQFEASLKRAWMFTGVVKDVELLPEWALVTLDLEAFDKNVEAGYFWDDRNVLNQDLNHFTLRNFVLILSASHMRAIT